MTNKKVKVGSLIEWVSFNKTLQGVVVKINKPKYQSGRPLVVLPLSKLNGDSYRSTCTSLKIHNVQIIGDLELTKEFNIINPLSMRNPWKRVSKIGKLSGREIICLEARDGKQSQAYKDSLYFIKL